MLGVRNVTPLTRRGRCTTVGFCRNVQCIFRKATTVGIAVAMTDTGFSGIGSWGGEGKR